jgi:aminoglycoside phosphotransferase family enzyme/predicted kinase
MTAVEHRAPLTGPALATALMRPEAYGDRSLTVEVRETHISWVFLAGDRAYKLKKPVRLPFLDYGTVKRRRAMCDEEVRLNRRLAPRVYLGVKAVVPAAGGVTLAPAHHPDAIDYVVEMRRFEEDRTLGARVRHGGVPYPALVAVGRRLAEFHAAVAERDAEYSTGALKHALDENAQTLLELAPDRDFARQAATLAHFMDACFAARRDDLEARAAAGLVRDGHGDLRAEHVLLEHGVEIVDCLEFDPALRITDVGCDLAFLTMDLEALGSPFSAATVLESYREAGGDAGDDALVAFFGAYRALVRAKVALVRAGQAEDRERRLADARARLALADRLAWRVRRPGLVLVAGLSATGKTTFADLLAKRSGLRHLSSDAVRKQLLGIAPAARADAAAYGPSFNRRTYEELGRLARGGDAVVDATFRNRDDRAAFLAALGGLPESAVVVECRAPLSVRLERARRRGFDAAALSDADAGVVRRQSDDGGLAEDVPAAQHVVLRTDRPAQDALDDLTALLDARLRS